MHQREIGMMIVEEILETVEYELEERKAQDVLIGLSYTMVKLDDGRTGLANTIIETDSPCRSLQDRAGDLSGENALQLAEELKSTDLIRSSLGLATINAVVNSDIESDCPPMMKSLDISEKDTVGMVGHFRPLVDRIKERSKELYVIERKDHSEDYIYPDWTSSMLLPRCDKVIISGSTLINKTIDHLLSLCDGTVGIMGPSTTHSPVFKEEGVGYLFGSRVVDPERLFKIISEGGGTRAFGETVEKVNQKL